MSPVVSTIAWQAAFVDTYWLLPKHLHYADPIYEPMPAWDEDITVCRTFDELPQKAQDYVLHLEELSGVPISYIGVGLGRDQTIVRNDVMDR